MLLQDQRPHTLYMHKVSGVTYILHPDKCGIHFRNSLFAVRVSCLAYIQLIDSCTLATSFRNVEAFVWNPVWWFSESPIIIIMTVNLAIQFEIPHPVLLSECVAVVQFMIPNDELIHFLLQYLMYFCNVFNLLKFNVESNNNLNV